jgi:hypothetical protein
VASKAAFSLDMSDFFKKVKGIENLPKTAARAIWTEANRLETAVTGLVPVATGYLQSTVAQDPTHPPLTMPPGGVYETAVTVGDADTPYALEVHETAGVPTNRGLAWNPVEKKYYQKSGQGKFLEFPFFFAAQGMERRLMRDIQGDLR